MRLLLRGQIRDFIITSLKMEVKLISVRLMWKVIAIPSAVLPVFELEKF
jgi:hypothetical protein